MKKIVCFVVIGILFGGCSKDEEVRIDCQSCKTDTGERIKICDNNDGSYELSSNGESITIYEEGMKGLSPEEFVNAFCKAHSDSY